MVMMMLVFIWGFSEAVWFFIIPDVILSLHALRTKKFKYVLYANLICVTGAAAGGVYVFIWSSLDAGRAEAFMTGIPAVHDYMIEHVHRAMTDSILTALITGPLFGVPYKLFAAAAPEYTGIVLFLLFTVPARLLRFIAVSTVAFVLSSYVFTTLSGRLKIIIWCCVWITVYFIYFSIHSPF
ncbi:hypothetical protein BN1048_02168 [Jeotgalicoccus saudimassiliensis]|uniref:SNARE associated Golgi protein n=2 Tax=Jeotgalicoccus saudimassiliensis TaxID=1461582 RepID=A0A078ME15_9STAP|nr:hypothetical protein BN1048_02168 [Jeotgalicoccus saudimassiliensis]